MLSTGLSDLAEIDAAVERLQKKSGPLAVFQCTTQYPSPPQSIGLNIIEQLRARYSCAVGLSDHSGTIFPALAAAMLGVQLIEVHLTLSRDMFGPDVVASVTLPELEQLITGLRFIERMNANPVDKTQLSPDIRPLRGVFLKSVVLVADLPAGRVLSFEDLTTKKPGTGIAAHRFESLPGRVLARDVKKDVPLTDEDLV
jgi:N-acetylneuraminate synthase